MKVLFMQQEYCVLHWKKTCFLLVSIVTKNMQNDLIMHSKK